MLRVIGGLCWVGQLLVVGGLRGVWPERADHANQVQAQRVAEGDQLRRSLPAHHAGYLEGAGQKYWLGYEQNSQLTKVVLI